MRDAASRQEWDGHIAFVFNGPRFYRPVNSPEGWAQLVSLYISILFLQIMHLMLSVTVIDQTANKVIVFS